ncbi:Pkinase-domain-containing protein [Piedraia hortae CBS 480.64]|uniref:non-specific serine/threonine protein kinase n=1 Tax=Piedraia hortae CBS 480.64 TaxID=1314780 RepID=A0A6A7BYQ4_9PEZI|nr:Pkinase-domain-containing protein [Piedraia hortae CBS 480.64]
MVTERRIECRERRRQPLAELPTAANTLSSRPMQSQKAAAHQPPRNQSIVATSSLAVHTNPNTSNKEPDSNRNSAVSASSILSGRKRKAYIGPWQLGRTIGTGGCSSVRVVRHRFRSQYGAVKIISRATAEKSRAQSLANLIENTRGGPVTNNNRPLPYGLEREIAIMKLLEHPNIVKLYDVWENHNELYIIMEYVEGGELFHYIDRRGGLSEEESAYVMLQIVSALLYCHRHLICHRDLKPENILLDQRNSRVKLIDFGMAALQPEGRKLTTPCGSPHYAAPEVISARPYDGTKADVWSCGVILYVMLTGFTPFNYSEGGNFRSLFRDIMHARYQMPPYLSNEARDLISRIFVPDPSRRITMDEVWDHPFLHKWDEAWRISGHAVTKEAAIGPVMTIERWGVGRVQDIDRSILRNMRTLWHSEPEQKLIQKLLNAELNQEKLFYAALIKHRDENLEQYEKPEDADIAASDHHHHHGRPPPVPRTASQFSIMNDEHLRIPAVPSAKVPADDPGSSSSSSFDPYHAQKAPMEHTSSDPAKVSVHRRARAASGGRAANSARPLRRTYRLPPAGARPSSTGTRTPSGFRVNRSQNFRPSASRSSIRSQVFPSSPPVMISRRPSDRHKRGVTFRHRAGSSSLTGTSSPEPQLPLLPREIGSGITMQSSEAAPSHSSPVAQIAQAIRLRKERVLPHPRPAAIGQSESREIRTHSAELERACEEAFFRSSPGVSSLDISQVGNFSSALNTPSSLAFARNSGNGTTPRPLPMRMLDTPNTYLNRTLAETRQKLAAHKPEGGDDNASRYEEVMRLLDNIVPPTPIERRSATAPTPTPADHIGLLPIISEEGTQGSPGTELSSDLNWRTVSDPVQQTPHLDRCTVRIVTPSAHSSPSVASEALPSPNVAPLNVRKRSRGSAGSDETVIRAAGHSPPESPTNDENEDPVALLHKIRSGWLGRSKKRVSGENLVNNGTGESGQVAEDVGQGAGNAGEPAVRKTRFASGSGLAKWLGRKSVEKFEDKHGETQQRAPMGTSYQPGDNGSETSPASSTDGAPSMTSSVGAPIPDGDERSWFARFLRLKPCVKVIPFAISRRRCRHEMVDLMRTWEEHGIRDLLYSREMSTITARIGRENALHLKPVSFRIEIFVVLDRGRRANLSIARFVQVKGAASSLRKLVEVVTEIMSARDMLVTDKEKRKALLELVT